MSFNFLAMTFKCLITISILSAIQPYQATCIDIYEEHYKYEFKIVKKDKSGQVIADDTLTMQAIDTTLENEWMMNMFPGTQSQKKVRWSSKKNNKSGIWSVVDEDNSLLIKVPTSQLIGQHFINFYGITCPFPSTIGGIPPRLNSTVHIEHYIPKRYGIVNNDTLEDFNKTVNKQYQYVEKEECQTLGVKNLDCYLMEGENTNYKQELGHCKIKAWFTEEYGFVKWLYETPEDEIILFELIKVTEGD